MGNTLGLGVGFYGLSGEGNAAVKIYTEPEDLPNSENLGVYFDFARLTSDKYDYSSGDEVTAVTNLGAAGSGKNINSNEGTPRLDTTTLSKASMVFDGNDDILNMAAAFTTTNKAFTLFMVFQLSDISNDYVIARSSSSLTDYMRFIGSGGTLQTNMANEGAVSNTLNSTTGSTVDYTLAANVPTLMVFRRDSSGNAYIYFDNFLYVSTKTNAAMRDAANFTLGAIGGTTDGTKADITGVIGEIGLYDADIGTSQIEVLMANLCTKWGIDRRS
jgi:hypothetical protein